MNDDMPFRHGVPQVPAQGVRHFAMGDERSSRTLLEKLALGLHFPLWAGRNWNALLDILSDSEWCDGDLVIISHETQLAELPDPDRQNYLEVLAEAVHRNPTGLEVWFPQEAQ